MKIKNSRLIINENEIDEACEQIRKIVQDKLDLLGYGNVIANVDFYNEADDDFTQFWNEINIDLLTSDGFLGNIQYTTEGIEPTLVVENDEFEFYYVFTFSSNTCTSLKHMVNIGFCEFNKDTDVLLENVLVDELINIFGN